MRRRLVLLAVAISLMVALSFVIPLAFLVRDLAQDRALAAGERQAQDIARVIATLTPDRGVVEASKAIAPISDGNLSTSLILPDGSVVGGELLPGESPTLAITGTAFRTAVGGDQIIYTPVIQEDGETVVVRVVVSEAALSEGVMQSWEVLAGVGNARGARCCGGGNPRSVDYWPGSGSRRLGGPTRRRRPIGQNRTCRTP